MPSMRRARRELAPESSAGRPSRRVLVLGFFSSRCERNAFWRRNRPVPVTFTLLAAPRPVFILPIVNRQFVFCEAVARRPPPVPLFPARARDPGWAPLSAGSPPDLSAPSVSRAFAFEAAD